MGERARFGGVLTGSKPLVRTEVYYSKVEHIGTYTETDEDGNTVTRDRYRTWYERHVDARAPSSIGLRLPDGSEIRSGGSGMETTHLDGVDQPSRHDTNKGAYAYFISRHEEGDEATIVGVPREVDGHLEVDPEQSSRLVLGSFSTLRWRVALQLFVLAMLALTSVTLGLLARQLVP